MTLAHDLPFDPTYGYSQKMLLKVGYPPGPPDFEAFWRDTYKQTLAIPTNVDRRQIKPLEKHNDLYEIEYTSLAGRVGGWLSVPKDGKVSGAMVIGHGYGGREQQGNYTHDESLAILCPCARGFHRSAQPDIPNTGGRHVLHGIESKETYIHRFNVAELWSAATVLLELFPHTKSRLFYYGTSFGGGLGAMMLPWDSRIVRGFLEVPSFGNHPLRVTMQCNGSGESVRLQHNRRGDVMPVVQYFDAATAASFIRQPTMVAPALFDPAVPPPGQFAVYNAISAKKKLFIKTAGHFGWSGEGEEHNRMQAEIAKWFAEV